MFELFLDNRTSIQNVFAVLLLVAALWRGGGPERACAGTLVGMIAAELGYHALFGPSRSFHHFDLWHFTLDTAGLVVLVTIALRANRFYPLAIAAAQLVAFTSHIVRGVAEPVSSLSYYLLFTIPFWFQLIILAIGIARHGKRAGILGRYRDWRPVAPATRQARYS